MRRTRSDRRKADRVTARRRRSPRRFGTTAPVRSGNVSRDRRTAFYRPGVTFDADRACSRDRADQCSDWICLARVYAIRSCNSGCIKCKRNCYEHLPADGASFTSSRSRALPALDARHLRDLDVQRMLARIFTSLFLRACSSPTCGWAVRAVIVLTSRDVSPRGGTTNGGLSRMVPVR